MKARAYRDRRGPGRGGVRAILGNAARRTDRKGVRDVAPVRLLHAPGLRPAEAVALDVADVDLEAGVVFIVGKGHTEKERFTSPGPTPLAQFVGSGIGSKYSKESRGG